MGRLRTVRLSSGQVRPKNPHVATAPHVIDYTLMARLRESLNGPLPCRRSGRGQIWVAWFPAGAAEIHDSMQSAVCLIGLFAWGPPVSSFRSEESLVYSEVGLHGSDVFSSFHVRSC